MFYIPSKASYSLKRASKSDTGSGNEADGGILSSLSSLFFNQRLKTPPQGGFLLSVVVGNLRLTHRALRSQNVRPFGRKVAVLQAFAFVWTIDARVAPLRLRARTLMTPEYQLSAVAPRPPVPSGVSGNSQTSSAAHWSLAHVVKGCSPRSFPRRRAPCRAASPWRCTPLCQRQPPVKQRATAA
jgi:hypothetical protein